MDVQRHVPPRRDSHDIVGQPLPVAYLRTAGWSAYLKDSPRYDIGDNGRAEARPST